MTYYRRMHIGDCPKQEDEERMWGRDADKCYGCKYFEGFSQNFSRCTYDKEVYGDYSEVYE